MSGTKTEYEVEEIFINQLKEQGYSFVSMSNYDDVLANFRVQFCKVNEIIFCWYRKYTKELCRRYF